MALSPTDLDLIPDCEVGEIFMNSRITRARWRREGGGPPFIKIGRRVFYRREQIAEWMKSREARSTAELRSRVSK